MPSSAVSESDYRALAALRYQLRCFLNFSEARARDAGLEPQQHQLLLAIRGLPEGDAPTIRKLAERLQIAHNSAVELVRRCVEKGLVTKAQSERDGREVLLLVTPLGKRRLEKLARSHREELRSQAPLLLRSIEALLEAVPA
jgi:DNA-binding MarR family transcriptional regulator